MKSLLNTFEMVALVDWCTSEQRNLQASNHDMLHNRVIL
jgi:hypothetical protein